jgi:hypothetical protein
LICASADQSAFCGLVQLSVPSFQACISLRPRLIKPFAPGLVNLRDLRIICDDLQHAVTQRADLLTHDFPSARFFIGISTALT